MKISQEQKAENRRAIIQAAVDLVIDKGLKGVTMRGIARAAGVADATVYNYFPTKEAIFHAYYEDRVQEAVAEAEGLAQADFTLQERLQALFEALLEGFLGDREFVQATFRPIFITMPPHNPSLRPVQDCYLGAVGRAMQAARDNGELGEQMFEDLVRWFFWDHFMGIMFYWLRDESEGFTDTSTVIDLTLGLACAALRAGIVNKVFDVCAFLFRTHVLSRMDACRPGLDALRTVADAFMEGGHGRQGSRR